MCLYKFQVLKNFIWEIILKNNINYILNVNDNLKWLLDMYTSTYPLLIAHLFSHRVPEDVGRFIFSSGK
jgi:hypothetical protein